MRGTLTLYCLSVSSCDSTDRTPKVAVLGYYFVGRRKGTSGRSETAYYLICKKKSAGL